MEKIDLVHIEPFRYLSAIRKPEGGHIADIQPRLAVTIQALTNLTTLWKNKEITTKTRLIRTAKCRIAVYICETWTIIIAKVKRIHFYGCYDNYKHSPIIKNKAGDLTDLSDNNNYRSTAIATIAGKLFESLILFRVSICF